MVYAQTRIRLEKKTHKIIWDFEIPTDPRSRGEHKPTDSLQKQRDKETEGA